MGLSSLSLLKGSDFSTGDAESLSLDVELDRFLPQFLTSMCRCVID